MLFMTCIKHMDYCLHTPNCRHPSQCTVSKLVVLHRAHIRLEMYGETVAFFQMVGI